MSSFSLSILVNITFLIIYKLIYQPTSFFASFLLNIKSFLLNKTLFSLFHTFISCISLSAYLFISSCICLVLSQLFLKSFLFSLQILFVMGHFEYKHFYFILFYFFWFYFFFSLFFFSFSLEMMKRVHDKKVTWQVTWCDVTSLEPGGRI